MGKQINFYMSEEVEKNFIELLKENCFEIMWHDFTHNSLEKLVDFSCDELSPNTMYLFKPKYGDYIIKDSKLVRIDAIKSPVIEFIRTNRRKDEKTITRGRLWLETKYYDSNDDLVEKTTELIKDYNNLVRWIKKNVPYREITKGDYLVKEYVNDEIIELVNLGFRLIV